jgi:hypothetical protein
VLTEQEIAVARHHADRHTGVDDAAHAEGNALGQRFAKLIVADPRVEQIPEEIDTGGFARGPGAEGIERFDERRPRRREMQIG